MYLNFMKNYYYKDELPYEHFFIKLEKEKDKIIKANDNN